MLKTNTKLALHHFAIGDETMPIQIIWALVLIKKSAAIVNFKLGKLDCTRKNLIIAACEQILEKKSYTDFPLSVWQSGSGTQTNMNVNEVVAACAEHLSTRKKLKKIRIHPNDHVNLSQSSNDVFPTAMYIAAVIMIKKQLLPSLTELHKIFRTKQHEFAHIIKIGRTHLQDAIPLTLGQEFSGYVSLLERNIKRIKFTVEGLSDLAIGGSAVGTGFLVPHRFAQKMVKQIATLTKIKFKSHPNKFAAISAHDELVFASNAIRTTAGTLLKIANDLRWLGSGPRCGIGELHLPANEPGSSIMPGKTNPTQCEALMMVATQIFGNDLAINLGGTQGNFELNTTKPLLIYNFLQSTYLLADAAISFGKYCVTGLRANKQRIAKYVEDSLMLATALSPILGYDKTTAIAKLAFEKDITLREACLQLKYLSAKDFDKTVVPKNMV